MYQSTKVTRSRFEIIEDGEISYLEFETDDHGWMTIWHTEVAEAQRKGLGLELVTGAFQYARDNKLKVDVICPSADHLLKKPPELRAS